MMFLRRRLDAIPAFWVVLLSITLLLGPLALHIINVYGNVNSWQITEWLISYNGGFVRRGVGGEIVKLLSFNFELAPPLIIILLSVISWFGLVFFILKISRGIIPSYIVLSPVFLGMPIYSDFLVRKDVLGVLILALALLISRDWTGVKKYVAVNILMIFAH